MGTSVIIGLSVLGVGCAIAEKILESAGKNNIAEFLRISAISAGAATAIGIFITFIKAMKQLG